MEITECEAKWRELNRGRRIILKQPIRQSARTVCHVVSEGIDGAGCHTDMSEKPALPIVDLRKDDRPSPVSEPKQCDSKVADLVSKGKGKMTEDFVECGTTQLSECSNQFMGTLPPNLPRKELQSEDLCFDTEVAIKPPLDSGITTVSDLQTVVRAIDCPSFDIGFGIDACDAGTDYKKSSTGNQDAAWVDTLLCDLPTNNIACTDNGAGVDVNTQDQVLDNVAPLMDRNTISCDKDHRIAKLELELTTANELALKLKCDLDVKDRVKAADDDLRRSAMLEASKDLVDLLRAEVAESREVQKRLSNHSIADKKRIKFLENESWHLNNKLSNEVNCCIQLKSENVELKTRELNTRNLNIELVMENDKLNIEIEELNKCL